MTFFYDLNKKLSDLAARQTLNEGKKPDFLDLDKDGDKKEPMKKAVADKKKNPFAKKSDEELDEGIYQGGPDKSQIPAVNRLGNKLTTADLEKERTQSPTSAEGMRALQDKLSKIHPLDEKMSDAQSSDFAALAPPKDKITFADKIAGAKKEVDEMLGDVAAEAMKKALGGGMGRKAEMEEKEDLSPFTNYKKPRADKPKVGSIERGKLHDIEHTATGRKVTRRVDPNTGNSVGADDDTPAEKRGRGRPGGKGAGKSIGAKGPSGKSKLMTREGDQDIEDQGEYDQEGEMAKDDIKTIVRHAQALEKVLGDNDNLPEWVQAKLAKIEGMMTAVDDYMQNQAGDDEEEPIAEKAVSKKQQKFMGMVHAAQKGEKPASKEVGKVAKSMGKKDAEDFAGTKHKGLPEKKKPEGKKKEESVEETTVSGSVATAPSGTATKGKGGVTFGKGVYESYNNKVESILVETMSVNASMDSEGHNSLNVTATDEDALKLAELLKMAGLGGESYKQACPTCGSTDCGCDQVDEDLANSANNTNYSNTDTMVNTLSGGLDGRKSTGQTVLAPLNLNPARQGVSEAIREEQESRLWELYTRYSK